jgi:Ca2+-binding EF-hand superfamily protein
METLISEKIRERSDGHGSVRNVFRELDWNHSGTVSPGELQAWLKRLNIFPNQETFHRLWTKYDPHGRGFIGYQDFVSRISPRADGRTSIL